MSQLQEIFYCPVRYVCWDTHGREYPVKPGHNWKHINVNNKQVGISTLPKKIRIRNFDDFAYAYWTHFVTRFPCPAMGYFVYLKMSFKPITLKRYYAEIEGVKR